MPGFETEQKILLKCGANGGSALQYWRNLVEKANDRRLKHIADGK